MRAVVTAVSSNPSHALSKANRAAIELLAGIGVADDAHGGETVKHRSRVARDAAQPNLRQVHLMQAELHEELLTMGFSVGAGEMGENVTTRGINLLDLPTGARLHLGAEVVIEVTGLRTPCGQLDAWQPGLMAATLGRDDAGNVRRKAGIMSVVATGGVVKPGDAIAITLPNLPHLPLIPV